ncbi:hypothetical protein N7536_004050 [Penicillium majusculum]|uniref:Uncharacterized protein n=1 Tax=Penicillium solitum TaxID=60172 RepID=A0A1V6QDP9_9EURO|nr:uncharacterized protein PENSOL_c080G03537 [Penicillium solitum]KAJ5693638.1 hypothetical protein N7536_004050 [Penicillium majusculum]OQD87334.1 hypothetical protein PENSOL_c080G03537 [Penicillium solitum]
MSLLVLPNELLLSITSHLESQRDINALAQANWHCHSVVNLCLYAYNISKFKSDGLIWACTRGELHTVQKFLDRGPDYATTIHLNNEQRDAMRIAIENGHERIVELLLGHVSTPYIDDPHCSYMTLAIYHNRAAVVVVLLKWFYDAPALLDDGGLSLLYKATYHLDENDDTIFKLLLDHGFGSKNVANLEPDVQLSLNNAACKGNEASVKFMLDRGVDIDFRSEEYECLSPLSCAIIHDRTAIAKLLLERGADPYIKPLGDWQEFMPLYIAALLGRTEVVQALLDHVGTDGMDGNGKFPQFQSSDEFFEQITDLSMTNYEDWSEGIYCDSNCCVPLCAASMMGREDFVRILLDHRADPNLPDPNGDLALGRAAKFGHEGMVRLLLERGAYIDPAGSESTALR